MHEGLFREEDKVGLWSCDSEQRQMGQMRLTVDLSRFCVLVLSL